MEETKPVKTDKKDFNSRDEILSIAICGIFGFSRFQWKGAVK